MSKQSVDTLSRPGVSRRGFMIGATSAVYSGLCASALLRRASSAWQRNCSTHYWYSIAPSGEVSVNITKAEMGQHVGTALARIVAEELEANWGDVRINHVDTEAKYGLFVTGGSWSVWQNFDLLSRAGAAGRASLIEEGAKLLGEKASDCVAENSFVVCKGKRISFGDIVAKGDLSRAYTDDQLAALPIKARKDRKLVGANCGHRHSCQSRWQHGLWHRCDLSWHGLCQANDAADSSWFGREVC